MRQKTIAGSLRAFSLLELLVVIGIIGILVALLVPVLEHAVEHSRLASCAQNMHQIGIALYAYSGENSGLLPVGPGSPSTLDPARPANTLGTNLLRTAATSQLWGLGLLTNGQLKSPGVLVCPSDNDVTLRSQMAGMLADPVRDAYGSYGFRQLDQNSSNRLTVTGVNVLNGQARALAFDWQSKAPAPYAHDSHDYNERLNILYADGHVQGLENAHDVLLIDADDASPFPSALIKRIDQLWVTADYAENGSPSAAPHLP